MQCERAQEFFSEYLEGSLDRPMTIALESHVSACGHCREDIEGLRETIRALDSMPAVDAPWDGPYQVMSGIRSLRAAQSLARRQQAPAFLVALRSMSPARAAMAASLATLIVVGATLPAFPGVKNSILSVFLPKPPAPAPAPLPAVQVDYGVLSPDGLMVDLKIAPPVTMQDAEVHVLGPNTDFRSPYIGRVGPQNAVPVKMTLPAATRDAASLRLTVSSQRLNQQFGYLVTVPLRDRHTERVSLVLENGTVDEALRRLSPHLAMPIVAPPELADNTVTVQNDGGSAYASLKDVAGQVGAHVLTEDRLYRLVPNR